MESREIVRLLEELNTSSKNQKGIVDYHVFNIYSSKLKEFFTIVDFHEEDGEIFGRYRIEEDVQIKNEFAKALEFLKAFKIDLQGKVFYASDTERHINGHGLSFITEGKELYPSSYIDYLHNKFRLSLSQIPKPKDFAWDGQTLNSITFALAEGIYLKQKYPGRDLSALTFKTIPLYDFTINKLRGDAYAIYFKGETPNVIIKALKQMGHPNKYKSQSMKDLQRLLKEYRMALK